MADIESLNFRRALRENNNTGVTPLDMLKDVVARIERGEIEAGKAFIMLADADGAPVVSFSANVTLPELITLAEVTKLYALQRNGWMP